MAKKTYKNKNRWMIAVHKHQEILELLRAGVGVDKTARIVGVGVRTVQRRQPLIAAESLAEILNEDGEAVAYRDVRWRCPVHGWVKVHPCVLCTTLAAMNATDPLRN